MLLSILANAQTTNTGSIKVLVKGHKQVAMENVTRSLLKNTDWSLVKLGITDDEGSVDFEQISFGTYIIKATMVNYEKTYSDAINVTSSKNIKVALSFNKNTSALKEVIVERKRPLFRNFQTVLL